MKKVTTLLLALLLAVGCLSAVAADIPSELPTGTLTEDARAYKSNSTKSGTAVKLKKGAEVTIVGQTDSFYWVISGNDAGHVLKKYVVLDGEEAKEEEKEPTRKNIGTRKVPALVGEKVTFDLDNYYAEGTLQLTMTDIVSGSEALNMVLSANMFNEGPRSGYEYVAVKFTMKYVKDNSGEDSPIEFHTYHFECAESDYSVYDSASVVEPEPEFSATLYEGASSSGWVVFEVKPNETTYALFNPSYTYKDAIWFKIQ